MPNAKKNAPALWVQGLASAYEIEHLARIFFSAAHPCLHYPQKREGQTLLYARCGRFRLAAGLRYGGRLWLHCEKRAAGQGEDKARLARMLYALLKEATGLRPPWGMLTGVRPVRLMRKNLAAGGEGLCEETLLGFYDVSAPKYALAREVLRQQEGLLQGGGAKDYSLYVSIPFCPTRCSYCSFVSKSIEKEANLLPLYLEKLGQELSTTACIAKEMGLVLRSIYVGGGTPTVLSAAQLAQLLRWLNQNFAQGGLREFTVEAGRPDCTTLEKLQVLKEYGVNRVSVNPQSMNETVLMAIGRKHTAGDILRCVEDARKAGLPCVNMDVIAGLPADTPLSFADSFARLLALQPENITVHTLTLKKGSQLAGAGQGGEETAGKAAAQMVEAAYPALWAAGYRPYYLYRQKNTPANLENTGWTKPGFGGYYNSMIMEEVQTIVSVGAGGVTKLVAGGGAKIKRLFNDKYPLEYVKHFEKALARKEEMREIYAGILDTETAR